MSTRRILLVVWVTRGERNHGTPLHKGRPQALSVYEGLCVDVQRAFEAARGRRHP